ncbi:hypothetical protein ACH9L7_03375 [Haloferax sp. S1W]|uniref:DUF7117 family protein n=1 Tax=Haloferax sp. S1W TaxID=3377110 RepID=UPI0037C5BBD5
MEIRGERECKSCGRQWSYFETGSVSCPYCGSMKSVGVGDRKQHTSSAATLDLSPHRAAVSDTSIRDAAPELKADLRDYIRKIGFIHGGDLRPLSDEVLVVYELLHAVDIVARSNRPTDDEQFYVLELLRGADDGDRLAPGDVPDSMTDARGLAYAEAVDDYRRDLSTWLDENPDPEVRKTLGSLSNYVKRAEALEGAMPLDESETLVLAVRDIHTSIVDDDLDALASARDRLASLL